MPKKNHEKEHIVYDDHGEMTGLYSIDVDKAKKLYDFWEGVDAIVQAYVKIHPKETKAMLALNAETRASNKNEHGTNKAMSQRHALSLPSTLYYKLEEYDPALFDDKKKLHTFMRRYKGFTSCKTI